MVRVDARVEAGVRRERRASGRCRPARPRSCSGPARRTRRPGGRPRRAGGVAAEPDRDALQGSPEPASVTIPVTVPVGPSASGGAEKSSTGPVSRAVGAAAKKPIPRLRKTSQIRSWKAPPKSIWSAARIELRMSSIVGSGGEIRIPSVIRISARSEAARSRSARAPRAGPRASRPRSRRRREPRDAQRPCRSRRTCTRRSRSPSRRGRPRRPPRPGNRGPGVRARAGRGRCRRRRRSRRACRRFVLSPSRTCRSDAYQSLHASPIAPACGVVERTRAVGVGDQAIGEPVRVLVPDDPGVVAAVDVAEVEGAGEPLSGTGTSASAATGRRAGSTCWRCWNASRRVRRRRRGAVVGLDSTGSLPPVPPTSKLPDSSVKSISAPARWSWKQRDEVERLDAVLRAVRLPRGGAPPGSRRTGSAAGQFGRRGVNAVNG